MIANKQKLFLLGYTLEVQDVIKYIRVRVKVNVT